MFRDVPGCSGMFRNVPGCSMFLVLSTPICYAPYVLLQTLATTNTKPFKPAKGLVPWDKTNSWVEVIQALKRHHKLTINPIIDSWNIWFITENYDTLNSIRRTVQLHKYISFSIRVMLSNIIFEICLSYLSCVNYWSHERIIAYHQVLEDRKLHQC